MLRTQQRAELNQELTITLHGRESANAGYFEHPGSDDNAAGTGPAEIRPAGQMEAPGWVE